MELSKGLVNIFGTMFDEVRGKYSNLKTRGEVLN